MSGLDFRIEDLVREDIVPSGNPMRDPSGFGNPGGGGAPPSSGLDPYTGTYNDIFMWDMDVPHGWDAGYWYGRAELLLARLDGTLNLRVGTGEATFTRASTTTRTNRSSVVEAVAANEPAFDWMVGPAGTSRYCYRNDNVAQILSLPCERNLRRRVGGLSVWVRPSWAGSDTNDRVLFQSGNWRLSKPSGGTTLKWSVKQNDGVTKEASFNISAWTANTWHHLFVGWDRTANRLKLWTDNVLRQTTATTDRYEQLDDNLSLGSLQAGGSVFAGYLVDARTWNKEPTDILVDFMYQLKA